MIKTGISGLRGTVTSDEPGLTAVTVVQWVQAYVAEIQARQNVARPRIALGHDARRSSPALAAIARGALLLAGADVPDLGLTMTPTVQLYVRHAALDGGIMVTASHNPLIYNGLKFLDQRGFFLPSEWWAEMEGRIAENRLPAVALDDVGTLSPVGQAAWQVHLARALNAVDPEKIRARHFRVALDACNGGALRWAEFLRACGCETILLHSEQHGYFSREAEPLPQHLSALQQMVCQARCDIGFAADPDGDRLVLVDSNGAPVSEEHTVVLVAMALFTENDQGTAVVNVVTTHALEGATGATVIRTAVGEMNVVEGVLRHDARLGGEGSGGIIVPPINMARDGLAAIAMILTLLAREQRPLHELVSRIPPWRSIKAKLSAKGAQETLRVLFASWVGTTPRFSFWDDLLVVGDDTGSVRLTRERDTFSLRAEMPGLEPFFAEGDAPGVVALISALATSEATLDLTDGIKIASGSAWLSLRPSNTEPVVRLMGEIME